jgi:hypothetical protein
MHYRKITDRAIEDGLLSTDGKSPEATMVARLSTDIKRRNTRGLAPRFRAAGRGMYALATPVDPLGGVVDAHNESVRSDLRALLAEMDPRDFERLVGQLLSSIGFEDVEVTKFSGDKGIDVRATLTLGGVTDVRTAVQVKRWSANVRSGTVRELRGGLGPHERGMVINLAGFSPGAQAEALAPDRTPIALIDGDRLIELMIENEIGIASRSVTVLTLDEDNLLVEDDEAPDEESSGSLAEKSVGYTGSKALSMWPLPGGKSAWKTTLDEMLLYIAAEAPTTSSAVAWVIENFDRVSSPRVVRGYFASVLRPLGLIATDGDRLLVTASGTAYLDDPSDQALLKIARTTVAGFDEILARLETGPASTQDLYAHLRSELGVTWETDAQVRFRLGWLEILGAVDGSSAEWRLCGE